MNTAFDGVGGENHAGHEEKRIQRCGWMLQRVTAPWYSLICNDNFKSKTFYYDTIIKRFAL